MAVLTASRAFGDDLQARVAAIRDSVTPERQAEIDERLALEARRRVAERLIRTGVPPRYRSAEPDGGFAEWCEGYLSGEKRNLYAWGRPGTGKTHQACGCLNRLARAGVRAEYKTFYQVLRDIRETYGGDGSEAAVMRRLAGVPVLLIDDIGQERPTPDATAKLFELLNDRYATLRPTLFTSNRDPRSVMRWLEQGADADTVGGRLRRVFEDAVTIEVER